MKKVISIFMTLSIILLLTACNNNTPSKKVESYLANYTSISDDVKMDIDVMVDSSNLSEVNKEKYKEVLEKQYKNIKYEITNEYINGDEATVDVNITVYDYFKVQNASLDYLTNNQDEFYIDGVLNNDMYDEYKLKSLLETNDTTNYTISFYLTKKDNEWIVNTPSDITLEKIHGLYDYTK